MVCHCSGGEIHSGDEPAVEAAAVIVQLAYPRDFRHGFHQCQKQGAAMVVEFFERVVAVAHLGVRHYGLQRLNALPDHPETMLVAFVFGQARVLSGP